MAGHTHDRNDPARLLRMPNSQVSLRQFARRRVGGPDPNKNLLVRRSLLGDHALSRPQFEGLSMPPIH